MHYAVLIIGEDVEKQLAPFDESLDVPRVITTEELIAKSRKDVEDYKNGMYADYLANPEEYLKNCSNVMHCKYISDEFPLKLEWNDEQHLKSEQQWCEDENINEDGSINTLYNINSKWDWYQLGGRWVGMLKLNNGATSGIRGKQSLLDGRINPNGDKFDSALFKDVNWKHEDMKDFITYAVLKDGVWYERDNKNDNWDAEFQKLIKDIDADTRISVVDIHI